MKLYVKGFPGFARNSLQQLHSMQNPQNFTRVFAGNARNVTWIDIKLNMYGYPYIAFSVIRDPISRGERVHTEEGGFDHRYHYALWNGDWWHENEIAYVRYIRIIRMW